MLKKKQVLAAALMTGSLMAAMAIPYGVASAGQPPTQPADSYTTTTQVAPIVTNASWTATGVSGYAASGTTIVECAYPGWTATDVTNADAQWIWEAYSGDNNGCGSSNIPTTAPAGTIKFSTTFNVAGTVSGTVDLQLAVDNEASVTLNGDVISLPSAFSSVNATTFATGTVVSIPGSDFNDGANTLTITAINATGGGYNPGGLKAALSGFTSTSTTYLTSTSQCKMGGWHNWQNPTFTNQGDCVSYVVSHGNDPARG